MDTTGNHSPGNHPGTCMLSGHFLSVFTTGIEDIPRLEFTILYTNGELRRPRGVCRLAYFKASA
jgi:hypothetical protein